MKRKVVICKILSAILMAFMLFSIFSGTALATGGDAKSSVTSLDPNQFNNKGNDTGISSTSQNLIGNMITIIQVIGTGVAIIMLIWLAIKYITAAPNEKAEIKKTVTIYVVGAIVLFTASTILGLIKNFATSNISS